MIERLTMAAIAASISHDNSMDGATAFIFQVPGGWLAASCGELTACIRDISDPVILRRILSKCIQRENSKALFLPQHLAELTKLRHTVIRRLSEMGVAA